MRLFVTSRLIGICTVCLSVLIFFLDYSTCNNGYVKKQIEEAIRESVKVFTLKVSRACRNAGFT